MKFKAKRTGRRLTTRVVISGDDRDPQGIWDRLFGFFSNLFTKLFGKIEYERSVTEPDEEFEFEGTAEELAVVKEASEGTLRTKIQGLLASEARKAEQEKLERGFDPRKPMAGAPDEQIDLMREMQEFISQKREEGYSIHFRKFDDNEEFRLKLMLSKEIDVLGLSAQVVNALNSARIVTVLDLVSRTEDDLLLVGGFDRVSLQEVKDALSRRGLKLEMELSEE